MGYLLFAFGLSVLGIVVVVVWHRRPRSMKSGMREFSRALSALAPDGRRRRQRR